MLKSLFTTVLFFTAIQIFASTNDTIWNQTDKDGRKQGYWRISYETGKIKYQGFFKDNKPVGEMRRYYEDGVIRAIQYFGNNNKSKAKLYYQNGILAGEGNFIESIKDSVWKYYSYYDKTLKLEEKYSNGVKEGYSKKYYPNGQVAEEILWHNNLKQGPWNQYYEDSIPKLKANYINDMRNGDFLELYPNGKPEIKGNFENNIMQGEWIYYNENGNIKTKVMYVNGIPKNADVLKKQENDFFRMIDNNKGKFPEPDETNIAPTN